MDYNTKCVFNESSLGKQYSAKGILERCELNVNQHEKHYPKSKIFFAENIQNAEANQLKINPIDILLRVDNTSDYVQK